MHCFGLERAQREGLELELLDSKGELEVAMMEISSLQQKLSGQEEECVERNKIAKEWYDALQVYTRTVCTVVQYV